MENQDHDSHLSVNLPKVNAAILREMRTGESRIFEADNLANIGSKVTHYASKMNCRFLTSQVFLTAPKTGQIVRALCLTMIDEPS